MIFLACETSTLLGSVSLVENGRVLAVEESMRQGSHSDVLNIFVEKVLQKSGKKLNDIDLFVSSIGPGSFTGIRISVNAIKSFAYCHKKPVMEASSLASLAFATRSSNLAAELLNLPIISMINAYKNMCYVSTHRFENSQFLEIKKPEVVRVQNLDQYITEKSLICGDGFSTYQKFFPQSLTEKMIRSELVSDEPHAKNIAIMASQNLLVTKSWNELLPLYLRASEAEENLQGIKYQPLI
jgi:tRNA threonylcarbamoyladenosine biosynthesis protein TsaB